MYVCMYVCIFIYINHWSICVHLVTCMCEPIYSHKRMSAWIHKYVQRPRHSLTSTGTSMLQVYVSCLCTRAFPMCTWCISTRMLKPPIFMYVYIYMCVLYIHIYIYIYIYMHYKCVCYAWPCIHCKRIFTHTSLVCISCTFTHTCITNVYNHAHPHLENQAHAHSQQYAGKQHKTQTYIPPNRHTKSRKHT